MENEIRGGILSIQGHMHMRITYENIGGIEFYHRKAKHFKIYFNTYKMYNFLIYNFSSSLNTHLLSSYYMPGTESGPNIQNLKIQRPCLQGPYNPQKRQTCDETIKHREEYLC